MNQNGVTLMGQLRDQLTCIFTSEGIMLSRAYFNCAIMFRWIGMGFRCSWDSSRFIAAPILFWRESCTCCSFCDSFRWPESIPVRSAMTKITKAKIMSENVFSTYAKELHKKLCLQMCSTHMQNTPQIFSTHMQKNPTYVKEAPCPRMCSTNMQKKMLSIHMQKNPTKVRVRKCVVHICKRTPEYPYETSICKRAMVSS